ncbi:MAG: transglycosylase-associated protein [uncultured bacterium]|nr:MAG: transglycosylase-associated protein [uncultured bacterium]
MSIVLWIILGGLAGWIASLIVKSNQGILADIILGILGAIAGGIIMGFFQTAGITGFNLYSLVVSVIGAIVLIWLGRLVFRQEYYA